MPQLRGVVVCSIPRGHDFFVLIKLEFLGKIECNNAFFVYKDHLQNE